MGWGTIELEDEVVEWLARLEDEAFGQAERYIDLLAEEGVHLGEPFTRQLRGKLRELRFSLDRRRVRITYYIASGRRIVLLTVFVKKQRQERREIDRGGEGDAAMHRRRPHRGGGLMTGRPSWDEVKAARADSPDRRRGYEKAGRAIRLAMEIRALREARGLSQRELAERVGTTQSAIARLEGGNVSPSLPTLDKIAEALDAELSVGLVDLKAG